VGGVDPLDVYIYTLGGIVGRAKGQIGRAFKKTKKGKQVPKKNKGFQ